jgi:cytochrome P450
MMRLARVAATPLPLPLNPLHRRAPAVAGYPTFAGAFPLVGHMPAIAVDYLGLIRRAERELGSVFWLDVGFGKSTLHAMGPEAFGLFKNKVTTSTYLQDSFFEAFGISVIATDGPQHHHMRTAMNPPFLPRGLSSSQLGAVFAEMIERRVATWPERGELRILAETRELVLGLMFRMLGVPEAELSEWRRQYEEFTLLLVNVPLDWPGSPRRRGRRARSWLRERLLGFIRDARARSDAPGLLGMLVHARDEHGASLSDDELIDNLRLLVLAGHETSASTMAWMVAKLAEYPDVWDAMCAEAMAVGTLPRTPKELRNFPHAEAVFRETLRLYPPVSNDARRAIAEFELGGRMVPVGTDVTIPIIHLSRQASLYERPDEFVPARWIGRGEAITPMEMVQFGAGPHFCLGYHVALMEGVQFAVAMALELGRRKLRPRLVGLPPKMRYLPLLHPAASTRIRFQ